MQVNITVIFRSAYILLIVLLLSVLAPMHAGADNVSGALSAASDRNWGTALALADNSGNDALSTLIRWQYMLDSDSGAGFNEIMDFIAKNPDWPDSKKLRVRAELSLATSPTDDSSLIAAFGSENPITGIGKIRLAQALINTGIASKERIDTLVKEGWIQGDFDTSEEQQILKQFGGILTTKDDIARVDRLLWDEKITPAKRLLGTLPQEHQTLFSARIALIQKEKSASKLIDKVSGKFKTDAGLLYERMRFRARKNDDTGVRQILISLPDDVPYPEKWWRYRELQTRVAIDAGEYKTAQKLLKGYETLEGTDLANGLWLDGWVHLEFLRESQKALNIFSKMYDTVKYPVSRARAAYWAAKAAGERGDSGSARSWHEKAAAYPTTFYGQLAATQLNKNTSLNLPSDISSSSSGRDSTLQKAIALAIQYDDYNLASRLISHAVENADSDDKAISAALIGQSMNVPFLSVRGAKKALQRNIVMLNAGYPTPQTPYDIPIERALALAIARQESEYDPNARSPANALGLMQLLPSTAKETAGKIGLPYSRAMLLSPDYNFTVGSHYLARLISAYDGSYVMAIAAYNAGPGNVSKWSRQFGTPGNAVESAINWIEKIPFSETRNYVQRVLENLQIYRKLENTNDASLRIADDLVR